VSLRGGIEKRSTCLRSASPANWMPTPTNKFQGLRRFAHKARRALPVLLDLTHSITSIPPALGVLVQLAKLCRRTTASAFWSSGNGRVVQTIKVGEGSRVSSSPARPRHGPWWPSPPPESPHPASGCVRKSRPQRRLAANFGSAAAGLAGDAVLELPRRARYCRQPGRQRLPCIGPLSKRFRAEAQGRGP